MSSSRDATAQRERTHGPKRPRRYARSQPPGSLPVLRKFYDALYDQYGSQHWWPGRTRLEIIVGAILTQNTSWKNVERAIAELRRNRLLTLRALEQVPQTRLASLIRSSGYFRQKARKLKEFVRFVRQTYGGSLNKMFQTPTRALRQQLLGVHGIGPETADCILLYAGNRPVFVVDAYTRRILERHQLTRERESYSAIQTLFQQSLVADPVAFNEYHALIVRVGKHFCRAREPLCESCALRSYLPGTLEAVQTPITADPKNTANHPELPGRSAGLRSTR